TQDVRPRSHHGRDVPRAPDLLGHGLRRGLRRLRHAGRTRSPGVRLRLRAGDVRLVGHRRWDRRRIRRLRAVTRWLTVPAPVGPGAARRINAFAPEPFPDRVVADPVFPTDRDVAELEYCLAQA